MRVNLIAASRVSLPAVARRIAVAALLAAVALVGRGVAATPHTHANPAKVWVINANVAAATASTPVNPSTFENALKGSAATRAPYLSQFDAFDAASGGQASNGGIFAGTTYIVVQTDGSMTGVSLNGRGLTCLPVCDGVTLAYPDASDHILIYEVHDIGTRSAGDTFSVTALQDSVSVDSGMVTVVGPAHDLQISTVKVTIQEGAASCALSDSTSVPTRSAATAIFTDINGTPLVGYSTDWASTSPATMAVAAAQTTSHVLPGGTTISAPDVACGVASGTADLSASSMPGAINGIVGSVTRTITITVVGVPAAIALTASPAAISCDGTATSTVTAKVTDSNGNNVADGNGVNFSVVALGTANPINTTTVGGEASSSITPLSGATAGVTVIVTAGDVQASIRVDCAYPFGDSSSNPVPILQLPFSGLLSTVGFTTELGESLPCGNMGATAWYELNLPLGGADLTIDTVGSSFNTALAVYTGSPASPPGSLSLLGCNANGASSSVRVIASSPGPYFIQAGGQNGATGWLTLNVRCTNDLDCDGLTDADEASLGTNPGNPDTDGDGLPDGLEVHTLHTNPLLADTDGDGCGDRKELFLVPPLSPTDAWDFYSVPSPALFAAPNPLSDFRDNQVSAFDAQAVFAYYKAGGKAGTPVYEQDLNANGIKDGIEYDRTVLGPALTGPPDGTIGAAEAQAAFAQFKKGYHC